MEMRAEANLLQPLSVKQRNAVTLLLRGQTDAEVALAIGVGRDTVNRWRNHHPEFITALVTLEAQQNQNQEEWEARFNRLILKSLELLEEALAKSDLGVALQIVQTLAINPPIELPPSRSDELGESD